MKMRSFFVVFVILAASVIGSAQARTVTNADLAKYKQERIAAEKGLRENYTKLGFSSPEERARRDAQSAKDTQELSARLRSDRLLREQAAAEVEQQLAYQARYAAYLRSLSNANNGPAQNGYGYYNYWNYGFGGFPAWYPRRGGIVWRADASGVVYEPGGRPSSIWTPVIRPGRQW